MAKKNIIPPRDAQSGANRERAAFERDVREKLDDTTYSIDDLSRVIFFANRTTQGQQSETDFINTLSVTFNKLNARNMELARQLEETKRLAAKAVSNVEELKRQIEELRRLAWL